MSWKMRYTWRRWKFRLARSWRRGGFDAIVKILLVVMTLVTVVVGGWFLTGRTGSVPAWMADGTYRMWHAVKEFALQSASRIDLSVDAERGKDMLRTNLAAFSIEGDTHAQPVAWMSPVRSLLYSMLGYDFDDPQSFFVAELGGFRQAIHRRQDTLLLPDDVQPRMDHPSPLDPATLHDASPQGERPDSGDLLIAGEGSATDGLRVSDASRHWESSPNLDGSPSSDGGPTYDGVPASDGLPIPGGVPTSDGVRNSDGSPFLEGTRISDELPTSEGLPAVEGLPFLDGPPILDEVPFPEDSAGSLDDARLVQLARANWGSEPLVLIFHSHTSESYRTAPMDPRADGSFHVTNETDTGITRVGAAIAAKLQQYGIGVVHSKRIHNYPHHWEAYVNSRRTVAELLERYPSIQVVLDIHREGIPNVVWATTVGEHEAVKVEVIYTTASEMRYGDHPHWQKNRDFAHQLADAMEEIHPGLLHRVTPVTNKRYNQDLFPQMVLLEVGNYLDWEEHAIQAATLLGDAVANVLYEQVRAQGGPIRSEIRPQLPTPPKPQPLPLSSR